VSIVVAVPEQRSGIDKSWLPATLVSRVMKSLCFAPSPLRPIKRMLAVGILLAGLASSVMAEPRESLLPVFGNDGKEFKSNAKPGHDIHGWLPKNWVDNSSWAPVSATYTKLTDSPDKSVGAVRIEIVKVDGWQQQLTTFEGNHDYKAGTKYLVTGWVRSPLNSTITVGFREDDAPRAFFDQKDLVTGGEWKRFEYAWTPEKDCIAWLFFFAKAPGMVDLAGIAVEEKP